MGICKVRKILTKFLLSFWKGNQSGFDVAKVKEAKRSNISNYFPWKSSSTLYWSLEFFTRHVPAGKWYTILIYIGFKPPCMDFFLVSFLAGGSMSQSLPMRVLISLVLVTCIIMVSISLLKVDCIIFHSLESLSRYILLKSSFWNHIEFLLAGKLTDHFFSITCYSVREEIGSMYLSSIFRKKIS